jgi:chromosome segregation ATPase
LDLAAFLNAPPTPPKAKPAVEPSAVPAAPSVPSVPSVAAIPAIPAKQDETGGLRDRVRVLSESVAALDAAKREMAGTLDASLQQIKQLQAEVLAKDKKLAKLRSVEQQAGDQVAQMRADSSSAQTQLEALRRDVMASEARARDLAASLSAADQRANEAAVAANERVAAARRRAEDAEAELEKVTAASRTAAALAERRVDEAAAMSSSLSDTAAHLQRSLDLQTARSNDLASQLASVQVELETTQHDFAQYKLEAHEVLARTTAEKSATAAGASPADGAASAVDASAIAAELSAVRAHCGELERQLREARAAEAEAKRAAARDVAAADASVQEAESAASKQARDARALREQLALETESANQRALSLQAEIDNLVQRARAADQEVQSLRQQLSASMVASSSDAGAAERQELENRLRTMTEHLIGKQNQIETLTSERSYLQLKLEQEQQQRQALEKFQKSARQAAASSEVRVRSIASLLKRRNSDPFDDAIDADDDDDVDTVVVNLESASPSVPPGTPSKRAGRSFVRKNAISVANALDALSSIAGRFLSLSPLARLFVIVYVVLLHAWVAYIVYSYQPEKHGADVVAAALGEHVSSELNLSHNQKVGLPHQA